MSRTRLLIGYDGSKDADGAIRAAGRVAGYATLLVTDRYPPFSLS